MTRRWRRAGLVAALVLTVTGGVVMFGPAPGASAHTLVVRTVPEQGQRLAAAPGEVSLEFSEPFAAQGPRLGLTIDGHDEPVTAERALGGRVLRADVATRREGVYVVSWTVVAEDGHEAAGEFAFGVGEAGAIPEARGSSPSPSPVRVVAGWLFFAGLALAAGSLAADRAEASPFRLPIAVAGVGVAEAGALVAWVDALVTDEPVRQRLLLAATAGSLAVAVSLVRQARRWPVGLAIVGGAIAWSARGHDAVANGLLGGALDAVHLLAAATWVGALTVLVLDLRRAGAGEDRLAVARRYAQLAAVLVVVLAAAGVGSAVLLLERFSDLWETGYGQTLLVKTALFAGALGLAAVGRSALARGRADPLRRVAPIEAGLLAGVLGVTAVLVNLAPPATTAVAAGGESLLGPAPIDGPVVRDAGLAGNLTVAGTAGADQLRVEVFIPGGDPAEGAKVDLEAQLPDGNDRTLVPRPCGPGCFTQRLALPAGTTRLTIGASAPDWPEGSYQARLHAPPLASDPNLLTDLVARMRAVPAVSFVETTTSGPGSVATPAPFSMTGTRFVELEPWAAGTADDIQPLPGERGLRMYLPGDRIWITVWQDTQGRITRERIVTMSHDIERDQFHYPAP